MPQMGGKGHFDVTIFNVAALNFKTFYFIMKSYIEFLSLFLTFPLSQNYCVAQGWMEDCYIHTQFYKLGSLSVEVIFQAASQFPVMES